MPLYANTGIGTTIRKDNGVRHICIAYGVILAFLSILLVINVNEAINITDANIKNFTENEIEIAKIRRPEVHQRITEASLGIVFAFLALIPKIPLFFGLVMLRTSHGYIFGLICSLWKMKLTVTKILVSVSGITYIKIAWGILYRDGQYFKEYIVVPADEDEIKQIFDAVKEDLMKKLGDNRRFKEAYLTRTIPGINSNAFAAGMYWDQNIYIRFRDLFEPTQDELVGILLHEAGHCYYIHFTKKLVFYAVILLTVSLIDVWLPTFSNFLDRLALRSFKDDNPEALGDIYVAVKFSVLAMLVIPSIAMALVIASTLLGRYFEIQADNFSVQMGGGEGLLRAFTKDIENSLESKSQLYSLLYEVHPKMSKRIENIKKALKSIK